MRSTTGGTKTASLMADGAGVFGVTGGTSGGTTDGTTHGTTSGTTGGITDGTKASTTGGTERAALSPLAGFVFGFG